MRAQTERPKTSRDRRPFADAGAALRERVRRLDWRGIEAALWERGWALTPPVLSPDECAQLVSLYSDARRFRSRVEMARLRFGVGEYKYFSHPLPSLVRELRSAAYGTLAPIANAWLDAAGRGDRFPRRLEEFLARCGEHGQKKPTPLLLRYEAGGYNCLHQDLYGDVAFPLQLTCFLSEPGVDHGGGEFLLVEQRPRSQSRGEAIAPKRGEMIIFASARRPARTARGVTHFSLRHGLSTVTWGTRYALGIIFHDAR